MKNKRFSALLLCAILLFTSNVFAQPEEASDVTMNESEFTAPSYILINLDNGEVLKENNPDKKINDLFDAYAPGVYRNDNK